LQADIKYGKIYLNVQLGSEYESASIKTKELYKFTKDSYKNAISYINKFSKDKLSIEIPAEF
jgi:hypothetical protein